MFRGVSTPRFKSWLLYRGGLCRLPLTLSLLPSLSLLPYDQLNPALDGPHHSPQSRHPGACPQLLHNPTRVTRHCNAQPRVPTAAPRSAHCTRAQTSDCLLRGVLKRCSSAEWAAHTVTTLLLTVCMRLAFLQKSVLGTIFQWPVRIFL